MNPTREPDLGTPASTREDTVEVEIDEASALSEGGQIAGQKNDATP